MNECCVWPACLLLSVGTKSKSLTPQWDIMAKRVSDAGRPSVSLQDEVHELDWALCVGDVYYKPQWGRTLMGDFFLSGVPQDVCFLKIHNKVPTSGRI